MNLNDVSSLRVKIRASSEILSTIIVLTGITFLIGWAFDISILKSPGPAFSTIKSNVALCFVLTGTSLWLLQTKRVNHRNRLIAQILAVLVLLMGLITLFEHLFHFNLGIDQMLFIEPPGALNTSSPNRMAFISTIELIIVGTALLILDIKIRGRYPAQYLMLLEGILALMVILGYLYGVSHFYRIYFYTGTAIYAGTGFVLIFFAVLAARPDNGVMKVFTGPGYGSMFGRRIIPVMIIILIVSGWLRIKGQELGYYDTAFGTGIYTISILIILTLLVWYSVKSLNKADKELRENLEELEHSNQELQSFAYITSHDLQEPLRTMASYAGLLKSRYKGKLDKDADEFIGYIISGATRMKSMIQGLLDYSRIGTHENGFKKFSSEKALDDVLFYFKSSIEKCNAEITYDPLPVVFADESQITRVFQNLIGNALKFRKKGENPKIHISAQKGNTKWIFSVRDNCIGIEEQYSDQIFEVFKRLHAIGEYQGVGIGLAIVKRIIDRHGGRVWVKSEYGEGSTFYFTLPAKK